MLRGKVSLGFDEFVVPLALGPEVGWVEVKEEVLRAGKEPPVVSGASPNASTLDAKKPPPRSEMSAYAQWGMLVSFGMGLGNTMG